MDLEFPGRAARPERDRHIDVSGLVLCGVGKLTGVVSLEPRDEVARQSRVVALGFFFADKDIDVVKGCHPMNSIDGVDGLAGSGFAQEGCAGTGFVQNCVFSAWLARA